MSPLVDLSRGLRRSTLFKVTNLFPHILNE
jgi:hypothetical protein